MIHVINRQTWERRDNIFTMLVREKAEKSKDDNHSSGVSDDNSDLLFKCNFTEILSKFQEDTINECGYLIVLL